ncbi:hypothetical protein [Crassaminicella indica]|uniref:Uncharacterized protein n=1 Tax=Crassaminicella indica TaxID=2855394 RepID=A0ABX8R977_9CLOT|nr:hypothetical protein [Crassaminicella indica]QXM05614.1 hypothetical protein KVH43_09545 [Crassaminicella indica]
MNELIPFDQNEIYVPVDELGIARFPSFNNKIFIFVIPLLLFAFLRNKNIAPTLSTRDYDAPKPPVLNTNTLDKMSNLLENVKKATALNDLKRNVSQSGNIFGKRNIALFKEALHVFSESMNKDSKANIQKIINVLSVAEKVKDVKNILNIQKAVRSENGDMSAQINNIIDAIAPMLPPEQVKNIDNFKKMAQMMKLMSLFDNTDEDDDQEDDKNLSTSSSEENNSIEADTDDAPTEK